MSRVFKAIAASTLALGLATAAPMQAEANPLIIAPGIAVLLFGGTALGGALLGATAVRTNAFGTAPGAVVVTDNPPPPPANCYMTRGLVHGVWRRVQVCN